MRKLCFITGTRAEYGLLRRVMLHAKESEHCELQIIATNMHLLPEYGETWRDIEADGLEISAKVPMHKPTDDAHGVVASMAQEMGSLNDALASLKPDAVVILGDRYEMLVAATVCLMHRIPIAHIHGGEITEGAYDDCIRHAISKLSTIHLTSTRTYAERVRQLGEDPSTIYFTGALGVENLRKMSLLPQEQLEEELKISLSKPFLLITYHPATLGNSSPEVDISEFLKALDGLEGYNFIFTLPNSDEGRSSIAAVIEAFCNRKPTQAKCFKSLGAVRYLSLMKLAAAVVGNSSSGILEAPSAGVPTLNIGDRQKGRVAAESVVNCKTDSASIACGLLKVLSPDFRVRARTVVNPYDGHNDTAREIFDILMKVDFAALSPKSFCDLHL